MNLKKTISQNLLNILGWQTDRKIIVIESDDWGSIRMPSKEAYQILLTKGYAVDQNPFNQFDSLESNDDVELLLNILSAVKDKNGNPALMTLNSVVANPDFKRIKESGYSEYFYEPFNETLKRYPKHDKVFNLIQQGIGAGLVKPQFHGREHLNVKRWMCSLQNGHMPVIDAFNQEMFSLHYENNPLYRNEYMDALDFDSVEELKMHARILEDGFNLFNNLWGFNSKSFIANCYVWHPEHEGVLNKLGVKYIQGIANQFIPTVGNDFIYKRKYHFQGQKNKLGQRYLLRNAFFEPYQKKNIDWTSDCLSRIETAFRWNKPAVISSHRVNFIGSLDTKHRDKNLREFNMLLKLILRKWPNVEFITSDVLGDLMSSNEK